MAEKKRKRGRPPGGEFTDKSEVVHFRVRPDTKALLEKAAQASGRTVSQECEHRLLRGLDDFDSEPTTAVLKIFMLAIDTASQFRDPKGTARWWTDPYLFEAAKRTFAGILDLFRPPGATPSTDDLFFQQLRDMGAHTAANIVQRVQLVDPAKPYARQTRPEVWYSMLRKELGALADRPVIWGQTAEELRKEHAELDAIRPLLQQAVPLDNIPEKERTREQQRKLERLRRQMREIESRRKS
jgi:hypothetical protein